MAVLVLQALAVQRRASGRAAEHEAPRAHVAGGPDQVADALEAEHRVVDEERDRVDAVRRVRGAGRDERRHRAGLGDALLEDLAVLRFLVVEQLVAVDRVVELPHRRVDAHLAEERLHAEGARLVGDDRHHHLADLLVAQQLGQHPHERHRRRDGAALGAFEELGEAFVEVGEVVRRHVVTPLRQVAAERLAALLQVRDLDAVVGRLVERRRQDILVVERDVEARAEAADLVLVQLLLLVRRVLALARLAEAVALDRAREDDRRTALRLGRGLVGGVHLLGIVSAQAQLLQLVVREVLHQVEQLGVLPEEVLAQVRAVGCRQALVLAVDDLAHAAGKQAGLVLREQLVPLAAPDHLDDVPARAAEDGLELVDDRAVAPHRPVEPLQVAVDDEDQVVELLARRQRDRAERLRLVALAVAEERPHAVVGGLLQAAVLEVLPEARLVDRHDRAEAHRHRRHLPEIGHQPRVRVRRQPPALGELTAEVLEVRLRQPAFEVRARVDAGRGVALEEHQVAAVRMVGPAEEVVEAHLVERGRRGVGRDVPADAVGVLVGAHHHRHRVPAHQALHAALDLGAAGERRLLVGGDGVDVGGVGRERQRHALPAGVGLEVLQQLDDAFASSVLDDPLERVEPFLGFNGGDVLDVLGSVRHGSMIPRDQCGWRFPTGGINLA